MVPDNHCSLIHLASENATAINRLNQPQQTHIRLTDAQAMSRFLNFRIQMAAQNGTYLGRIEFEETKSQGLYP